MERASSLAVTTPTEPASSGCGLEAGSRGPGSEWSELSDWTRVTVEVDFSGVEVT